jgi:uncharacterized protein YggE
MNKMIFIVLVSFGIICQVSAGILQQEQGSCCLDNSIIVNGQGTVKVQPDIAIVNVGITNTAKTSQQASINVADKIDEIRKILAKNKIPKDDIQTQSLSIYPQYEYPDGKMQLVGQTASQTLSVTVRGIDKNGGNLGSIIDQLVTVNELTFNGLNFDKDDKSDAQRKARKLAFEDARKKAQ